MAALLSTLVIATSATVVLVPRPAAADPIADLNAQATAISQSLVQEQLQAGAYQLQYAVASKQVAGDDQAITQVGQQIALNEQQIDKDTRSVRKLALVSYMNGGSTLSDSDSLLFSGNEQSGQVADEYAVIAAGDIEGALDQLRSAQHVQIFPERWQEHRPRSLQFINSGKDCVDTIAPMFVGEDFAHHREIQFQQLYYRPGLRRPARVTHHPGQIFRLCVRPRSRRAQQQHRDQDRLGDGGTSAH